LQLLLAVSLVVIVLDCYTVSLQLHQ
jgi:hypothetical protein